MAKWKKISKFCGRLLLVNFLREKPDNFFPSKVWHCFKVYLQAVERERNTEKLKELIRIKTEVKFKLFFLSQ